MTEHNARHCRWGQSSDRPGTGTGAGAGADGTLALSLRDASPLQRTRRGNALIRPLHSRYEKAKMDAAA
jgi:hypothetical protein